MNRNYIILAIIFIALSGGYFLLPEKVNYKQIEPQDLMWNIVQSSRIVTTDQVAAMIIEGDPTLELIDVRPVDEYDAFSLPEAINLPLDSIMVEEYQDYLGIEDMNVVFFANDDIKADQAWVIAQRMGYKSMYVMKGGLNCWIKTIIQPEKPLENASKEDFELYDFRRGASLYFTGAQLIEAETEKSKVNVKRKKKTSVAEGGC